MKKLGVPKRILWVWETICYSLLVAFLIKLVFTGIFDGFIALFCAPTASIMIVLAGSIYSDKIKWEKLKLLDWIVPLVVFVYGVIYGLVKDFYVFALAFGMLITFVLLMIVAFESKHAKTKGDVQGERNEENKEN